MIRFLRVLTITVPLTWITMAQLPKIDLKSLLHLGCLRHKYKYTNIAYLNGLITPVSGCWGKIWVWPWKGGEASPWAMGLSAALTPVLRELRTPAMSRPLWKEGALQIPTCCHNYWNKSLRNLTGKSWLANISLQWHPRRTRISHRWEFRTYKVGRVPFPTTLSCPAQKPLSNKQTKSYELEWKARA